MKLNRQKAVFFCFATYLAFTFLGFAKVTGIAFALPENVMRMLNYFPVGILACSVFFFKPKLKKKTTLLFKIFFGLLFSYFILSVVASFKTESFALLVDYTPNLLRVFLDTLFFTMLFHQFTPEDGAKDFFLKLFTVLLVLAGISIIVFWNLGFEQRYVLRGMDAEFISRPSGVAGNANDAGFTANLGIIFLIYFLFSAKSFTKRLFLFLLVLVMVVCVFATFSNTNQIILILVFLLALFKTKFYSAQSFKFFFILLLLLPVGAVQLNQIDFEFDERQLEKAENLLNILSFQSGKVNMSLRDVLFEKGMEKVMENPILGSGQGTLKADVLGRLGCHNAYLTLWGEAGIIPFLLYVLFLGLLAYRGFQKVHQQRNLGFLFLAMAAAFAIFSASSHNIFDSTKYISILMFIAVLDDYKFKI